MIPITKAPREVIQKLLDKHPKLNLQVEEKKVTPRIPLPCMYVGEDAGPKGWHYCEHQNTPLGDIVCACKGCGPRCPGYATKDVRPLPPNLKRNLLFHMHPIPGRWRWHIDKLKSRQHLFNGKRIIAVNTGSDLDDPKEVRKAFPGFDIIEVKSNPSLREMATFLPLFSRLSGEPDEVTLYAQSKAVTHHATSPCWRWAEMLYEIYMDYWHVVEATLKEYPIAGAFKKIGKGFRESASEWHYSGSWFWFRNQELYSKDWTRADRFWSGIETYPSVHYTQDQAGSLFLEGTVPSLNLYNRDYLSAVVEPAYAQWKMDNIKEKAEEGCAKGVFWDWLAKQERPRVLEIGTKAWDGKPPKHHRKTVLEVNAKAEWVGSDYLPGDGVDVVADAHELTKTFEEESFDAIVCVSTLEHLAKPWVAAKEMGKVLRKGGLCFVSTHQTFPVHGYPHDYFRFTDSALKEVFEGWEVLDVGYSYPCTITPKTPVEVWNTAAEAFLNVHGVFRKL